MFPNDLTSSRLYTFWTGVREEADLPSVRIHDQRHTCVSQGVMNGVGLRTVGRLLGHKHRTTTAIYAHLDDATLQDAAAQAAGVIAKAMGFKVEPPMLPDKAGEKEASREKTSGWKARPAPLDPWEIPLDERAGGKN